MEELNYRITFTEMELGITSAIVDEQYSTKWMTLPQALIHKAMRSDNARLIKRV